MLLPTIGVLAGLAVLTYAADQFVIGATRIAARLRLSTVMIGAVVIGFGTSAPELVVSVLAGGQGAIDLAVGNVVGSNVANLSLVLGAAALVTPVVVHARILKREAPLSLGAVVVFAIVIQDGAGAPGGTVLLATLVASLTIIVLASRDDDPAMSAEVAEFLTDRPPDLRVEGFRTAAGLVGTLLSAQLVVAGATGLAEELGLAQGFVGLTIVAIGTSLPELATAIQAARKRETDLILGNLLGSNLFNAGAVGAVIAFSAPSDQLDATIAGLGALLMVAVAGVVTIFMITSRRVTRPEGVILLGAYAAMVPLLAG